MNKVGNNLFLVWDETNIHEPSSRVKDRGVVIHVAQLKHVHVVVVNQMSLSPSTLSAQLTLSGYSH